MAWAERLLLIQLVLLVFSPVRGADSLSVREVLFQRDPQYDNLKVTDDADVLDLVTLTKVHCATACAGYEWCSSFFYTSTSGACALHGTVFLSPGSASTSTDTRYYRVITDWCQPSLGLLYNRLADLCVYFETVNQQLGPYDAHSSCVGRGWRLVSNLTPLKLDALLNITWKNPAVQASTFIGLKRTATYASTLEWMDGTPLDVPALEPYWEVNQPNGECCAQDCVVIRASVDSTLNDVGCGTPHNFICEALRP